MVVTIVSGVCGCDNCFRCLWQMGLCGCDTGVIVGVTIGCLWEWGVCGCDNWVLVIVPMDFFHHVSCQTCLCAIDQTCEQ